VNPVVSVPRRIPRIRQKEQRPRGRVRRQSQPRRNIAVGWSRRRARLCMKCCSVPRAGGCQRKSGRRAPTSGRGPGAFTEPPAGNCRRLTAVVSAPPAITCRRQKEQRPRGRLHRQHRPRRNVAAKQARRAASRIDSVATGRTRVRLRGVGRGRSPSRRVHFWTAQPRLSQPPSRSGRVGKKNNGPGGADAGNLIRDGTSRHCGLGRRARPGTRDVPRRPRTSQRKSGRLATTSGRWPGAFTEPPGPQSWRLTAVVSVPARLWAWRQKEQRPRGRMRRQPQPRRIIAAKRSQRSAFRNDTSRTRADALRLRSVGRGRSPSLVNEQVRG
jgi:hypothetical protein